MEDILFYLYFKCTSSEEGSDGIPKRGTLQFRPSSPPTTVGDLILKIEETMEIPESLVKLERNSTILDVRTRLDDLRVRTGDSFVVHYYSKADCQIISECIDWMKELSGYLQRWSASIYMNLDMSSIRDTHLLQTVGFNLFVPWLDSRSYANKLYFISKGGLDILSEIMNISQKVQMGNLPSKMQSFETQMLLILWNITEDAPIRRAVVQCDGIEICRRALLRVAVKPYTVISCNDSTKEIVEMSLGVISNLCELPEVGLRIASHEETVEQMLSVTLCPSFDDSDAHNVVLIFLLLSYSPETHRHLVQHQLFSEFLHNKRVTQRVSVEINELMRYHKALLCSFLLLLSPHCFHREDRLLMQVSLHSFIKTANHETLSQYECTETVQWDTILPYIKVLYQPVLGGNLHSTCEKIIMIALLTMLVTDNHRNVLMKEGLVDYIVCLPWYIEDDMAKKLVAVIREAPDVPYQPPSLLNMAKGAVSKYYCGLDDVMRLSVPKLAWKLWGNI